MKKIMFNDKYGLTQAVIDGRKTMTRRLCKDNATGELILAREVVSYRYYPKENLVEFVMMNGDIKTSTPHYILGEVVAVAQSYKSIHIEMTNGDYGNSIYDAFRNASVVNTAGWNNKMFVKAEMMPHQVQFSDIRIEPLQTISDTDCIKEGIKTKTVPGTYGAYSGFGYGEGKAKSIDDIYTTPRPAFASLINRPGVGYNGMWKDNPFVAAYEFKFVN